MNTEGTHNVLPFGPSITKMGLDGSQAVYPRASNVLRMPPDGNEDASGSLWMSWAPLNRSIGIPSSSKVRKASCFSAVSPVCGWNQWQKCVAPFSSAHSFTAWATSLAMEGSSLWPRRIVSCRDCALALGSFSRMVARSNVLHPKVSATLMPRAISGTERMARDVTWPIAQSRPVVSIAFVLLECAGSYVDPRPRRVLTTRAGHDPQVHRDLVLDLDRPAPRGDRLHAEVALPQRGLARGRQRAGRHLDAQGQGQAPGDAVEIQVARDLQVVDARL